MSLLERMQLTGRVALVTGGAGGIGAAVAAGLRELGAKVVLADLHETVLRATAELGTEDGPFDWVTMDVSNSESVDAGFAEVVRRHGSVDIVVPAAGVTYEQSTLEHSDANWRRVMSVNLDGVFYSIRAAGRHMAEAGGGSIVVISSICARVRVKPELHVGYDSSKAAVSLLCRNVAVEWADKNIRVNAVAPGYTDTELLGDVGRQRPVVMNQWLNDIPIHRLIAPREVADAVAFLASDAASGITGHELVVDGAYSVS